jgi:chromosome segregation protein
MITHNKNSMEFADTLFGITMEEKGISKIVSVNFDAAQSPN